MTPFPSKWALFVFQSISVLLSRVEDTAGQNSRSKSPDPVITWSTCGYSEMTVFLHQLVAKHSNIARLYSIGKSVEGKT